MKAKIEHIKKNPQVCFEVDNHVEDHSWQSVIAFGNATLKIDNLGLYLGCIDVTKMTGRKEA